MFFDGITFQTFDYYKDILYSMVTAKEERKRTTYKGGKKIVTNYEVLKINKLELRIDGKGRLHISGSPLSFYYGNNAIELSKKQYTDALRAFFDTLCIDPQNAILERSEFFYDFYPYGITPMEFVNRCFFLNNVEFKHETTPSADSEFFKAKGQARSMKAYTKNPTKHNEKVRLEFSAKSSYYELKRPKADILFDLAFQNHCASTLRKYTNKILFAEPKLISYPMNNSDLRLLENGGNRLFWKEKPSRLRNYKKHFQELQRLHSTNVFLNSIAGLQRFSRN